MNENQKSAFTNFIERPINFIGAVVGLLIAFGIWEGNKSNSNFSGEEPKRYDSSTKDRPQNIQSPKKDIESGYQQWPKKC
jgi:hypothetical protein